MLLAGEKSLPRSNRLPQNHRRPRPNGRIPQRSRHRPTRPARIAISPQPRKPPSDNTGFLNNNLAHWLRLAESVAACRALHVIFWNCRLAEPDEQILILRLAERARSVRINLCGSLCVSLRRHT